jgi:hypothetical protein
MKRMLLWLACANSVVLVISCATQKALVPVGGSRADGTVNLAFEYNIFEKPELDRVAAQSAAVQRCTAWGYTGAEAFGGAMQKCEAMNGYGNCLKWMVTVTYQCTGSPPSAK